MLILAREIEQTIIIDGNIKVTVKKINKNSVRFAIDAPKEVKVLTKIKTIKGITPEKPVSTYPDGAYLGALCNRKHDYRNTGMSMRYVSGSCIGCIQEKSRSIEQRLLSQKEK